MVNVLNIPPEGLVILRFRGTHTQMVLGSYLAEKDVQLIVLNKRCKALNNYSLFMIKFLLGTQIFATIIE